MKGKRGVEFVSVKKNSSLQHKLCITCEVSRGFVRDCSLNAFKVAIRKINVCGLMDNNLNCYDLCKT